MMCKKHFCFAVLTGLLFFCVTQPSFAQSRFANFEFNLTDTYIIELIDDTEFVGNYLGKDEEKLFIKTNSIPRIEIPFDKIKSIDVVPQSNIKDGIYWFKNPHSTRYLFSPSAFNLEQGEGYYQNTYLFLNSVAYGITDYVSVSAGLELISLFASGSNGPIFFVTVKGGGEIAKNFHLGGTILYVNVPSVFDDFDDRYGAFVGGALATYGSLDHNVTGGIGWGLAEGDFSDSPVFNLSGMTRIGKRTALVSENWFFSEGAIFSYGIRFFGEKISVDLAFLNNADIAEGIAIGIPYVDFVVKF